MSSEALCFAWNIKCVQPLDKLILIRFADACDEKGEGFINAAKYADWCGVDLITFTDAMLRLVNGKVLDYDRVYRYRLVGFRGRP